MLSCCCAANLHEPCATYDHLILAVHLYSQEIGAQLGLQDDEINELKADFDAMDTDKSGSVDVAEAKASLTKERNGKAPTEEEVQAMMAQFDQNGDAKVTFSEYAAVLCA